MDMLQKIAQALQCIIIETASSISKLLTEPLYLIDHISSGLEQIFSQDDDEDDDDDFDLDAQPVTVVRGFAN